MPLLTCLSVTAPDQPTPPASFAVEDRDRTADDRDLTLDSHDRTAGERDARADARDARASDRDKGTGHLNANAAADRPVPGGTAGKRG